MRLLLIILALTVLTAAARADDAPVAAPYKAGESWPMRNFEGADALEPLVPRAAWERGDGGRIVLDTALPVLLFAAAFAFRGTDHATLREVQRWRWAGVDDSQDNQPFMFGMIGLSILAVALPSPADAGGFDWNLRLDRATVLGASYGVATGIVTPVWKLISRRGRPDGAGDASRPSGHATAAAVGAAFTSDVLRDWLRPDEEPALGLRILKETTSALPYLGAAYMSLERVHDDKHFLTDTLLGDAIGAIVTHMLYAWSFTRVEEGRGWEPRVSVRPLAEGGVTIACVWGF